MYYRTTVQATSMCVCVFGAKMSCLVRCLSRYTMFMSLLHRSKIMKSDFSS